jgi:8-oxo-dGTP pyrophosphatase MutT (NUDIX family)
MGHIHEKIDFVVGFLVVFQNKVLFVDHKKIKMWVCPGGHVELDEDPEQTLFRELEEETGLTKNDVTVLSEKPSNVMDKGHKFLYTPNFLDMHTFSDTHDHIGIMYILKSNTDKVILEKSAHNAMAWVAENELDNPKYNLSSVMKWYAREAIKKANEKI